jgi:hypothetical protein
MKLDGNGTEMLPADLANKSSQFASLKILFLTCLLAIDDALYFLRSHHFQLLYEWPTI